VFDGVFMKVFIEKENKTKKFAFKGSGVDLLSKLKLNRESVILVKNGVVVTDDEIFKDSDDVNILSVVSGG
jgi:sulfur carrier protein ThiS